jgi:hypothetical protein
VHRGADAHEKILKETVSKEKPVFERLRECEMQTEEDCATCYSCSFPPASEAAETLRCFWDQVEIADLAGGGIALYDSDHPAAKQYTTG